jgi:hypothetical protein
MVVLGTRSVPEAVYYRTSDAAAVTGGPSPTASPQGDSLP